MRESDKRITMLSADNFAIGYWLVRVSILVFLDFVISCGNAIYN